jgi:DNA-binding winged helix-turn-helix (wHTH) protein/Tol biopolymer transport system component
MNERPILLKPVGPESLADEDDFQLGHILARPSLREVLAGERREILEPRVMQVLVVLARASGTVVSRDELIRQCWGGRIVSEDAINRCVSKIRQLAEIGGSKAFEIETIPRVGYRLLRLPPVGMPTQPEVSRAVETTNPVGAAENHDIAKQSQFRFALPLALAVIVIAATAAFLFFFELRTPHEWMVLESHLPFIATPMVERAPDFSPDGSMIVYSAGPDFLHRGIYLRLLSGGEPMRIIAPPFGGFSTTWSPDGSQIAFSAFAPRQPCRIMLVAALGGIPREVGRCRTLAITSLAWERTNNGILFSDSPNSNAPGAIYRLDLNGGAMRQVTHPVAGKSQSDTGASLSPDGKTLAFQRQISWTRSQIILQTLASGAERVLFFSNDDDDPFAWSDDSSALFIGRTNAWDSALWAYPVDGSAPQRITDVAAPIGWLSSGPKGLLAVDLERSEWDIAIAPVASGQPPTILDANGWGAFSMAYSNDGTLAVIARRSGATTLLLGGADGALHELLRLKGSIGGALQWSPDGLRLAFIERGYPDFNITIVDRGGKIRQRIPYRALEIGGLNWTEDGKSFFVTSEDGKGWRVWRVGSAKHANPQPVMPYGWKRIVMRGRIMLGAKDGVDGIWRLDGTPRQLTRWPDASVPGRWTLADDRIVYADSSRPDAPVFMAMPITGGTPQPVGYSAGLAGDAQFALNPKTGLVTYLHLRRADTDIGWLRVVRR